MSFAWSFRHFYEVKDIVFSVFVDQGEIAVVGTFILKTYVGNGDAFAYPAAAVGLGDRKPDFVRIGLGIIAQGKFSSTLIQIDNFKGDWAAAFRGNKLIIHVESHSVSAT